MRRQWMGVFAIGVLLAGFGFSEDTKTTHLSGTVAGPAGAVAGATVDLYLLTVDQASMSYQIYPKGQTTSEADGTFAFTVDAQPSGGYAVYCCLAQKQGLSCGWGTLIGANQTAFDITLTEPQKMIGFVQQPDGGPVAEAEVRLVFVALPGEGEQFMFGIEPVEAFATKTCSDGRFEFDNLPAGATAEIMVRKPGQGTLITLTNGVSPSDGLTYKAGQTEIMLTMEDGFSIRGTVVTQDGHQPVANISVAAMDSKLPVNLTGTSQTTSADGRFEFTDLAPGDYRVAIQDNDWIAEAVTVTIAAADADDTVIALTKGGVVEIKVIDSATEERIRDAQVNLRLEGGEYQAVRTDESGIARKQVLAGTYRVSAYAQGYQYLNDGGTVEVENNKTATLTVQLGGQTKIAGRVVGPDGKPVAGADVRLVPGMGGRENTTSDDNGAFKMAWDPQQMGWTEGEFYLVATCEDKNLAGVELIGTDTEEATVTLQPGVAIKGKVLNEKNEPLAGAGVQLYFRGSRFSTSFGREVKTDEQGEYVFNALATDQRYAVNINRAEGYGTGRQDVEPTVDETPVTVKDIVLRPADQKLAGQVVDVDGKGLAEVRLHCYGEGQPNLNTTTDADGKFAFDQVCSGSIRINANVRQGNEYLYGNVETEGGTEEVTVIVAAQGGGQRYVPRTAPSLVGKALPDLSGCGAACPADAQAVLVYAWDMNQRPSRHFLKLLAARADRLKAKGVTLILLHTTPTEKAMLDAWLSDNGITCPCGIMGEDAETMTFNMGIRSLPWLILTDGEHKVVAEGFSVEELEEKLATL